MIETEITKILNDWIEEVSCFYGLYAFICYDHSINRYIGCIGYEKTTYCCFSYSIIDNQLIVLSIKKDTMRSLSLKEFRQFLAKGTKKIVAKLSDD